MERAAGLVTRLKSRELRKTGGTLAELFVEEATGTVLWDTADQGPAPRGWGLERSLGVKLMHGKLREVVGCGSTDRGAQPYPIDRSVAEYKAIQNGARWRMELETGEEFVAAFEAACTVGATAVVLGDQPASTTKRRLQELSAERVGRAAPTAANSLSTMIRNSCATLVFLLLPSVLSPDGGQGIVTALGQRLVRDLGLLVMVGSVILSLPGINTSIFQEIKQGPELNEEDIEQALLHERDVYMARTLRTVLGLQEGLEKTPMFVLSRLGDFEYWRLKPDGIYNAKEGTEVVAVVGLAHLPGVCRAWRKAQWKKATSSVA
ncbi:hypothetical protein CYMTET_8733 [Cymbomonas tetramitiformis]|uniref:Uncharacterized protein n=1 Tax=Cymbomonas tetramitiformis TaxID=36881 RepID=A0AAE0GSV4_9CHLO|nr:hypothetical protein CYMTET_8733 [Cymbomonas tetramitiformis]